MYIIFLQCTQCVKKTLTVSCMLLCEPGDRVKVDQSSFSADLHAVMLRHHCSEHCVVLLTQFSRLCVRDTSHTIYVNYYQGQGDCVWFGTPHI